MADFYDEMAAMAREMLAPTDEGGLGQGTIELVRYVPGVEPANPWDPPAEPSREVTTLDGVARGVGKELVGLTVETGGQIVATDLVVLVAPWGGEYGPGWVLEVDGLPVTVLRVRNIPEAGITCSIQFVARR